MNNFISLSEETANKLMDMIVTEKLYAPASRIPNEKELSNILSVSRTSVREAVKILITNGVLEIKRGIGTFVTSAPSINSNSLIEFCSGENKQAAMDALHVRLIIEPYMVSYAVSSSSEKEKALIYKYEEECRNLINAKEDYTYSDHLFHKSIAACSHNATYENLLPILQTSITIILRSENFVRTSKESAENALIYHKKIVDAIKAGDIKGAEIASKTHIYNSIKILSSY